MDPASRNREIETGEDRRKGRRGTQSFDLSIEFAESCLQKNSPSLRFSASLRLLDAFSTTWIRIKELEANPGKVRESPLDVTWRSTARRAECCAGRCFKAVPMEGLTRLHAGM